MADNTVKPTGLDLGTGVVKIGQIQALSSARRFNADIAKRAITQGVGDLLSGNFGTGIDKISLGAIATKNAAEAQRLLNEAVKDPSTPPTQATLRTVPKLNGLPDLKDLPSDTKAASTAPAQPAPAPAQATPPATPPSE
jgi:type IV secretory pathway VirB10-like protein